MNQPAPIPGAAGDTLSPLKCVKCRGSKLTARSTPPSTSMVWPVISGDAAGEAMNTTAPATLHRLANAMQGRDALHHICAERRVDCSASSKCPVCG